MVQDRQPPPDETRPADLTAFVEGYAGAAFIVADDGSVVAANRRAGNLAAFHSRGLVPEIGEILSRRDHGGVIASGTVFLPGSPGNAVAEIAVIPWGNGLSVVLARDVTMERNLRSALVESRLRYKDLVEISSDFAWEVGAEGTFVFVTPRGALGYKASELIGRRPEDLVADPGPGEPLPFKADRRLEDVEMWLTRADGTPACVLGSCVPLTGDDGTWRGARGICRDVTEDRRRELALNRARYREQVMNIIMRTIRDELDPNNMLHAAATAIVRAVGVAGCGVFRNREEEGLGLAASAGFEIPEKALLEVVGGAGAWQHEVDARWEGWSVLSAPTFHRQAINGAFCVWKSAEKGDWDEDDRILVNDLANQLGIINEQLANHERILRLSRTDDLTGFLNRRAFYKEELPRRLQRTERAGKSGAMIFIDMDNFKLVNDVHGHQTGDEAILCLRNILFKNTRPGDLVARLGGDEFALWMDGVGEGAIVRRVKSLLAACEALNVYSGRPDAPLGISLGIAIYAAGSGESIDDLLTRADTAMYEAKRTGKGTFSIAAPAARKQG